MPKLYRFKIHERIKKQIVVPLTYSTLPVFISLTKLNNCVRLHYVADHMAHTECHVRMCVFMPVHIIFQVHMSLGTRVTSRAYPSFRFLAAHTSTQSSFTFIKQQNTSHPGNNKFIKYEYNYDCCLLSEVLLNITELIDLKALSKAKERPVDTVHTHFQACH